MNGARERRNENGGTQRERERVRGLERERAERKDKIERMKRDKQK